LGTSGNYFTVVQFYLYYQINCNLVFRRHHHCLQSIADIPKKEPNCPSMKTPIPGPKSNALKSEMERVHVRIFGQIYDKMWRFFTNFNQIWFFFYEFLRFFTKLNQTDDFSRPLRSNSSWTTNDPLETISLMRTETHWLYVM
jgi:hypothetical protein